MSDAPQPNIAASTNPSAPPSSSAASTATAAAPAASSQQQQQQPSSSSSALPNTAPNSSATLSSTQPLSQQPQPQSQQSQQQQQSSGTATAATAADPLEGDDIADADVDMLNPPPPGHENVLDEGNKADGGADAADKEGGEKDKEKEKAPPVLPGLGMDAGGAENELAGLELKTTRKDRNLREFLNMMDEYAPIIPDAVTDYYLALGGFASNDPRIKRLLALATQKFIADIAADAYQYSRIRTSASGASAFAPGGAGGGGVAGGAAGGGAGGGINFLTGFGASSSKKGGRVVLTMEDLTAAAAEIGVNSRRPEFYR